MSARGQKRNYINVDYPHGSTPETLDLLNEMLVAAAGHVRIVIGNMARLFSPPGNTPTIIVAKIAYAAAVPRRHACLG